MVDERLFASLRRTATLVHALPDSALVVEADERVALRVGENSPGRVRAEVNVSRCGFRNAVAKAWSLHRSGQRIGLLDLTGSEHLTFRLVIGLSSAADHDGVYRVRVADEHIALFVTTLTPERIADIGAIRSTDPVHLHRDSLLDTTLVHVADAEDPVARAALSDLATHCAVEELLESVNPMAHHLG